MTSIKNLVMESKIKIIIVDDSPSFLEGLTSLLERVPDYSIIGRFTSGDSFIEECIHFVGSCDIVLMDIEMPGKNGFETTSILNKIRPDLKFIAITMYHDKVYLQHLIECGFKGFVNKDEVSTKLYSTITAVMNNRYTFPNDLTIK